MRSALAAALAVALGCGGATADNDAPAAQVPLCTDAVVASIDNAAAPAADSNDYAAAPAAQLADLKASVQAAIAGDSGEAVRRAALADYELCRSGTLVRWRPTDAAVGRATIVWRSSAARGLIVGAPHPQYETNTLDEARLLFEQVSARALIVSGTHRCANTEATSCSGTTAVCGASGPYRESDMAHVVGSAFQAAHEVLIAAFATDWVVSLHGMAGAGASLSNGTTGAIAAGAPVARLAAALAQQFPSDAITTCNDYAGATVDHRLCGTTNVQGRAVNGSADVCTSAAAANASERFVHLEQSPDVRVARQRVVEAFATVVPSL